MTNKVHGDTELQSDVLEDLQSAVNYRRWLCSLGKPYFGDDLLEIGSGMGYYASDWADMGVRLTASEADPARLRGLHERFENDPRVQVRELHVPIDETGDYSAVVAYNVLEHVPEQVEALQAFAGLLRPGGAVVLVVPAFEFAMSKFDLEIGHQRRYTKKSMTQALTAAGLEVERCQYINCFGLFAWLGAVKMLNQRPKESAMLSLYDKVYVPVERVLESKIRPPFGQSVFAVARTPR
jgi:2-polyprenyl-3-methyl-5-hydroxy-6-metoxy-1,4-benzoquinol methylase